MGGFIPICSVEIITKLFSLMLLHPALQPLLAQFERLSGPAGVVGDCCGTGEPSATEQERERVEICQICAMMINDVYTDADLYL